MAKLKGWKSFSVLMVLMLVAALGAAIVPSQMNFVKAAPPLTNDWPMFQGNLNHTGVAYLGLNGINSPTQLWSFTDDNQIGSGSPVIADIDGDGVPEVLIGTANFANTGGIYALNGRTGTQEWKYQTSDKGTYATPPLADIDGDSKLETVFASYDGKIIALEDDGTEKWKLDKGSAGTKSVIADVNGDGDLEIAAGAASKIWLLQADGTEIWNKNFIVGTAIAVADVDGDGGFEMVFSALGTKTIIALNADGTTQWTTPATTQDFQVSLAITDDVSGDGKPDVIAGCRDKKVYAYSGADGSLLWSYLTVGRVFGIAVADINGDGNDDVIATATKADGVESYVYVLDGTNGALLWQHNVVGASGHTTACTPAIVDVNKDGVLDVVVISQNKKLYALSGTNGDEIWSWTHTGGTDASAPAIADINNDGMMDIVFAAGNTVYAITEAPSEVWVDDDYCNGCPNDGHTWGYDAFDNIQDGIDAVAGSTVHVAAGTYNEQVGIDKDNVTIIGNADPYSTWTGGNTRTVDAGGIAGGQTDGFNVLADGVTIEGFRFVNSDQEDPNVPVEINSAGVMVGSWDPGMDNPPGTIPVDGTTIQNCVFEWFTYGVYIYGSRDTTVQDCEFKNLRNKDWEGCGGNGVQCWTDDGPGHDYNTGTQILDNSIHDNPRDGIVAGSWAPTVVPDFSGMVISGNEVYSNASHGVNIMYANFSLTMTGNDIYSNATGIGVGTNVTGAAAHSNNIHGNTDYGVNAWGGPSGSIDATNNWWGANDGPSDGAGVTDPVTGEPADGNGDKVSANVHFDPWIQFTLEVNPAQIVADGTSQSDLTAKLKNSDDTIVAPDAQLNQLPEFAKVTFTTDKGTVGSSSVTKDLTDGQATAKLTSSTTVETATVTAQAKNASEAAISGATDAATVDFIPGASSTVTVAADPEEITADGTSTSTITATVKDQDGRNVADGTDVEFDTDHGTFASSTVTKQTVGGVATATLTSESSTENVIATVTATANGVSDTTSVFFIPAGGAGVKESKIETVPGSGTVEDTPTGGDVGIDATGDHTITTAEYDGNPGGSPSFEASGNYYDVHLDDDTGVNSLTIEFCPADEDTVIYYWNGTSWVACSNQTYAGGCIVVTITTTTTPSLADLSGAIFGSGTPTPAPAAPAAPAGPRSSPSMATPTQLPPAMSLQYLAVNPQQTYAGQPVTITTNVSNTGGATGSYTVVLMINGKQEASKLVSVGANSALPVTFTVTKDVPGTYTVTIGGQQSSFTILGAAGGTAGSPVSGTLIAVILIIGVLLIASVVLLFRRLA